MTVSIISDILTISTGLKLGAGAILHKLGQKLYAFFTKVKTDASKLAGDIKKDI